MLPAFARVRRGDLSLWLAGPTSSAARPMPDGRQPVPGGWSRLVIEVDDLDAFVARLRNVGVRFRNDVVSGPGGKRSHWTRASAGAPGRAGTAASTRFMRRVLATEHGGGLYRQRQPMIEPVFGQTKHNRRIDRFHRRGRAAVRTEWRLITATHNLLKLHRHTLATA